MPRLITEECKYKTNKRSLLSSKKKTKDMIDEVPSKKKIPYPVGELLLQYLNQYDREAKLDIQYSDLLRYNHATPILDKNGKDTLWNTVYYSESEMRELYPSLTHIYALLQTDGDVKAMEHLTVARVDYCTFGNSNPFRIRIINKLNDNYDHFYVKVADASRIYGLELEHILSPNRIDYLVGQNNTLIEAHIAGLPGDMFVDGFLEESKFNQIRIVKEFVKFNERCFLRLLGDMRSYNFVVDITPDIEGNQYRIRAIDFDQQSYEGRVRMYLPQFFKENNPLVKLSSEYLNATSVNQYQEEERTLISHRVKLAKTRLNNLFAAMCQDTISSPEKVEQLRRELADFHKNEVFLKCKTMGDLVKTQLDLLVYKSI